MRYKLKVKYRHDDKYTSIKSRTSRGSMQEVAAYLSQWYSRMDSLCGGVEKVKIVPVKDGE